ncbi:NADPH-dependent FMN reductase (plasmid) [Gemmatirosa kalamazoonensis]|uniref:NADPH-dependent FMN reductase n=1 Tax=Gemmatirosa kalamazoonensis TaxID=861299 RepID=W0RP60_9BACT|nr:NAD(P)H-dependent oxidoreductase [Gemmatirosa kalamazoonensis]AHG92526.1 NADPH-dependent FMN reductase [Gemmatirosa kalamazoonensis]
MPDQPAPETPRVRKGQGDVKLTREEFARRLGERFYDPSFDAVRAEIERVIDVAWKNYDEYHKSPRKRKAGPGFADPEFELPIEWLDARQAILDAQRRHDDPAAPRRILVVCAADRHDQTCPGEMSKTFRLVTLAREVVEASGGIECDVLDLSHLTAQYGRQILPCKACVSTAMPLCHWPCSCYPNHAMGQVNDWMNEIYPRWVAAHGVLIVTPVYWYQAPSVLKLMIDRLVCADGGNPDPTTTHGKTPEEAKALELKGWDYPRHLSGRRFGVVAHGDTEGADVVRRALTDWLRDMDLVPAENRAILDRYVGYYEPYATSHDALDRDTAFQEEVRNAARTLVDAVRLTIPRPGVSLPEPRPK